MAEANGVCGWAKSFLGIVGAYRHCAAKQGTLRASLTGALFATDNDRCLCIHTFTTGCICMSTEHKRAMVLFSDSNLYQKNNARNN